jgi:hypothetical protein
MLLPVVKTLIECVTKYEALRLSSGTNLRTRVELQYCVIRDSSIGCVPLLIVCWAGIFLKKAYACLKLCPYPAILLINKQTHGFLFRGETMAKLEALQKNIETARGDSELRGV